MHWAWPLTLLTLIAGVASQTAALTPAEAASHATTIAVGRSHTCAIIGGRAFCWGDNSNGQLGDNQRIGSTTPVAVVTSGALSGKTLTQITAGDSYTCALDSTGHAYCWGSNGQGQLGNPSVSGDSLVPVAVDTSGVLGGKTLVQIAASDYGTQHTCAIDTDGKAYCWGLNGHGQLGDGSTTSRTAPVAVDTSGALAGVRLTKISVGRSYTCGLSDAGHAYCWGVNDFGQLGGSAGAPGLRVPGRIGNAVSLSGPPDNEFINLPAGIVSTLTDFTVAAWVNPAENLGWSRVWDFGTGDQNYMFLSFSLGGGPLRFAITTSGIPGEQTLTGPSQVPTDTWSHVAVTLAGHTATLYVDGQPVDTNPNVTLTPRDLGVTNQNWIGRSQYTPDPFAHAKIDDFQIYSRALTQSEIAVLASGQPGHGDVASYSFDEHSGATALDSSGRGNNGTIISPATTATESHAPVAVDTSGVLHGKTLTEISTGADHTCAIDTAGKAYCWGNNDIGQLGKGDYVGSRVPVAVFTTADPGGSQLPAGASLAGIANGNRFTCAVDTAGKAYCWGAGYAGQLGINSNSQSTVPRTVFTTADPGGSQLPPSAFLTQVDAGVDFACATAADGAIYCWGANYSGQLGNGQQGNTSLVPVRVIGLPTVPSAPTIVSAVGGDTTAAITWTAPTSTGSGTLTGYTATARLDSTVAGTCSTPNAATLNCTITGLTNGVTYTVTVVAHSTVGDSPPSAPVTVTPRGVLSISAPASAAFSGGAGTTVSGSLGPVTVTDQTGNGAWTATVTATPLVMGGHTIPLANISYWSGPATATTGSGAFTPGQLTAVNAVDLTTTRTAFSLTGGSASNSAQWNPTLVITVPSSAAAGTYTATITHSVS